MKTVKLSPIQECKFPDIPDLQFYEAEAKLLYFNATHCIDKHLPADKRSVADFLVKFEFPISTLCKSANLTPDDIAVQDDKGAVYLEECMAMLFLWYLDEGFGPYLLDRAEEMLRYGFTVNDNMLRFLTHTRFDQ